MPIRMMVVAGVLASMAYGAETVELPDALVMSDGTAVKTPKEWAEKRAPELRRMFEEQMYGVAPPPPGITSTVNRVDKKFLGGKATKKEIAIHFGPGPGVTLNLLLIVPNHRTAPAPVFVGLNFNGNHTVVRDPGVALPTTWMPASGPGVVDHRATEAGRGAEAENWSVEKIIDRGYAMATFYVGDVAPDDPSFKGSVNALYFEPGQTGPKEHEWGVIRAWAWGASRAADYLVTDGDVDPKRIAVVGHSRNGKAALVAGAFDGRFSLVLGHQAGCGGSAPSRGKVGESVKQINDRFPHWFCGTFKHFNDDTSKLPFDQHELIALMVPRGVLLSGATEDQWSNPEGQFEMLQAADRVYALGRADSGPKIGLAGATAPKVGQIVGGELGYFMRPGKHSMSAVDWQAFLDFADERWGKAR